MFVSERWGLNCIESRPQTIRGVNTPPHSSPPIWQERPGERRGEEGRGGGELCTIGLFCCFCMFNIEVPVGPWEIMAFRYAHDLWIVPTNYSRGLGYPRNSSFWDYSSNSQLYSGLYFANRNWTTVNYCYINVLKHWGSLILTGN